MIPEGADPRLFAARWKLSERDLIEAAASILAIVSTVRRVELADAQHELATAERGVIALAMRRRLSRSKMAMINEEMFMEPARSFAWLCVRVASQKITNATFFHARAVRVFAPRLGMPLDAWRKLNHETDDELDRAEAMEPRLDHFAAMINERRRKNATDVLLPVALELSKGVYSIDAAQRLREAASILEGA